MPTDDNVPTSSLPIPPSLPPAYIATPPLTPTPPPVAARLRRGPNPIVRDRTAREAEASGGTSCKRRVPSQLVDARSDEDDEQDEDNDDNDDEGVRKRREVMPLLGGDGRGNGSGGRCAMVGDMGKK